MIYYYSMLINDVVRTFLCYSRSSNEYGMSDASLVKYNVLNEKYQAIIPQS